jgi:hypothetical protein
MLVFANDAPKDSRKESAKSPRMPDTALPILVKSARSVWFLRLLSNRPDRKKRHVAV